MKHAPGFTAIRLLCISSLLFGCFLLSDDAEHCTHAAFLVRSSSFLPTCTPPTGLIISEFRLRGPGGVNDEFIELYNNTDAALTVCTADGSSGWAVVSGDGVVRFVIPSDTTIPARGHLLATSSGYSLNSYAVGDLTYTSDIPDNNGIALFNTANPANFSTATRLDAVGFTSNASLYREGAGLASIGAGFVEYCFRCNLAAGTPADTNDNVADLQYLATDGTFGSKLGAPGPENLSSPIQRNANMPLFLLDTTVGATLEPNRFRDLTSDPVNNSTLGTLSVRRRITNNTGVAVSRLRLRVTSVTTYPPPSGTADLRARTSTALVNVTVNDSNTCASTGTPATPPCQVTVQSTTLEQPPNQPNGGGYNSTLSVALPQPLTAGASVNVHFLLGVQQTGNFQFFLNVEAMTDTAGVRLDPVNQTGGEGEDPLSRNFNWNVPILSLPGRAGLDLGLSLAYNSLVWTKSGSYISFDDDRGFPSPGFRLGFPVIQPLYYNAQAGKNAYLLITPNGDRVELRQVGTSGPLFESVDSSYMLLNTSTMTLRTTDGAQLSFDWMGSDFQCTEIKDRNGNFITINYNELGRISTIVDTLKRTINFNYSANNLSSITQTWTVNGSPVTHTWASFAYRNPDLPIQTNFQGLTNVGPQNGSTLKVLSQVTVNDGSSFTFAYTSWGQVWKISNFATDGHLRNYRSYNLPLDQTTAQTDCPRFTERRNWARNWNGDMNGLPSSSEETVSSFAVPGATSWTMPDGTAQTGTLAQVTLPDGTIQKIYSHATGWDKGLPLLIETHGRSTPGAAVIKQKSVVTKWNQDNLNLPLNPRVEETNVYDFNGSGQIQNRARTTITFQTVNLPDGTTRKLPQDVKEYQANATTVLRRTHTDYNLSTTYTNRRIIGLISEKTLFEVNPDTQAETLMSKVAFGYDETGSIQGNDATIQHDNTNYMSNFVAGRANLSSAKRYNVINATFIVTASIKYNTAGAVVQTTDASNHSVTLSYMDRFAQNGVDLDPALSFSTLAYPTTVTDPDGYTSSIRYNYDFGSQTWKQTPLPNTIANTPGPKQKVSYDSVGRVERVTNLENNAYIRFIYAPNYVESFATVNNAADEAHSLQVFDGAGRVIAKAGNHPGSTGGFSGQLIHYDVMGRAKKQSNPTETSISITSSPIQPYSWSATGDDAQAGWIYTEQTYDWKGRPLVTTNTDTTTKEVSYEGCGCAGGEVVTLTDEGTLDGGVLKRKQQMIYSDILGRIVKTEILNWQGGSVYSTTVNTYNARDQITQIRQYAGPEGSGTFQDTTISYDGHGRLKTKHVPEQNAGTATTWDYNADDTIQKITDARGASQTFSYNNRHLLTGITYAVPVGSNIPLPAPITYIYDAAGNRTSMNDGLGSMSYQYDALSRLMSETRTFSDPTNPAIHNVSKTLTYDYNLAGTLKSITDATGAIINYNMDAAGRINAITGSPYGGVTSYASNLQYRAWGALKHLNYGNGKTLDAAYNARLQPTSFTIPTVTAKTYDYYADGSLRFSSEAQDHRFDRSYTFDHVARIKEAFSGAEARGEPATTDRPYKQTFSYDSMGHLIGRNNHHWTEFYSISDSYQNNRRNDWNYDADGNLLNSVHASYTYDAADQINTVQAGSTLAPGVDGDGQQLKSAQTWFNEETQTSSTITIYYLRSTVLGGEVVTEMAYNGVKGRTFVYAGGARLAWQEGGIPARVMWEHRDPSNASFRTSDATGYTGGWNEDSLPAELDPTGADNGTFDPYVELIPPSEENNSSLLPYPSFSDPRNPGITYSFDGIAVPVDYFFQLVDTVFHGRLGTVQAFAASSTRRIGTRNRGVSWGRRFEVIYDANGRIVSQQWGDFDPNLRGVNYGIETSIYNSLIFNFTWLLTQPNPQNSQPDANAIRDGLKNALSKVDCSAIVNNLLNSVETKKNPRVKHGSILAMFDSVVNGSGGLTRVAPPGSAGHGSPTGSLERRNAGIFLEARPFGPEDQLKADIKGALAELMHLGGQNAYYTDRDFAEIVHRDFYNLTTSIWPGNPADTYHKAAMKDPNNISWSYYWHQAVDRLCFGPGGEQ
jgi:YD repeat-containing protein